MKLINNLRRLIDTGMSMYLVVTLALFALFGVSFTAALAGLLPFHAVDLVVTLSIFMGVSFGASYVFAYLFNVKAHHKSALITGGILFFIFSPVLTISNALLYGFIAIFAVASKYILVWRGRHVFNPAAIAAVIVLSSGLGAASWWIAGISFAIPVALLAFLILYRTERLQMAGVFLLVYIITMGIIGLGSGQSLGDSMDAAFTAWFPLFFVGFMLSEPLTLPARHSQRFVVASLVAFLIGLQPLFSSIYLSPEVALVAGNLAALFMTGRVGIRLKLAKRKKFPGNQEMFEFKPSRRLRFRAGQYLELSLPHAKADLRGERRFFTIASAPESETLCIATRFAKRSSTFKTALRALKEGDEVAATMICGDFLLPKDPQQKLLFLAGGIGITPFRAHLESLQKRGENRDIVVVQAVRQIEEVLFKDILFPKDKSVKTVIVAPDIVKADENHIKADMLSADILRQAVPDIVERTIYISGSPAMVASLQDAARKLGAKQVKTDNFMGY